MGRSVPINKESILVRFKDNIEVICIDLTEPEKVSGNKGI